MQLVKTTNFGSRWRNCMMKQPSVSSIEPVSPVRPLAEGRPRGPTYLGSGLDDRSTGLEGEHGLGLFACAAFGRTVEIGDALSNASTKRGLELDLRESA